MFKKLLFLGFAVVFVASAQVAKAETQLVSVTKQVRNVTQNSVLAGSTNARIGDTLEYIIRVVNTSGGNLGTLIVADAASSGLGNRSNISVSRVATGGLDSTGLQILNLENNGVVDVRYTMQVQSSVTSNTQCNTAIVSTNGQSFTSTACGYISNSSTAVTSSVVANNMRPSLTVINDTKNVSGTVVSAGREDFLTYKFTATNAGSIVENGYVVKVDLSGVLPLADVVDFGGGSLSGNTISYPAVNITPGSSITQQVRVRVKYNLPPYSFVLATTYGNEVKVNVRSSAGVITYVAPKVGGNTNALGALTFGLLFVLGALIFGNKKIKQLIFK